MERKTYLAIDLKSFYASVECRERGLDPLDTNLVVADESRTDKTICLAVTPPLKSLGIPGRARLFEVRQRVREANAVRRGCAPGGRLDGASWRFSELQRSPRMAVDFLIAPPRMAYYIAYSTRIYEIYMKYVSPEDILVYSIDEVFMDVTPYLRLYGTTARELAVRIVRDVFDTTGITAAAGIGTNLFLCKAAMDIVAKHVPADENGARIAVLDEMTFRRTLWTHRPLTDFWRVGHATAARLERHGLFTMGDVARCSVGNEDLLYRLFGKNAELLIDHAWGWEPCTVGDARAYRPSANSISSGQVLTKPYPAEKARLVLQEMADRLSLDLVAKGLAADQLVLTVGYDTENLNDPRILGAYRGDVVTDAYGRRLPKQTRGTEHLGGHTASTRRIVEAACALFDRVADKKLLVRRLCLAANHVLEEAAVPEPDAVQLRMFPERGTEDAPEVEDTASRERERRLQLATLAIRKKYGGNAVFRGMDLQEDATARIRSGQIGGHRA